MCMRLASSGLILAAIHLQKKSMTVSLRKACRRRARSRGGAAAAKQRRMRLQAARTGSMEESVGGVGDYLLFDRLDVTQRDSDAVWVARRICDEGYVARACRRLSSAVFTKR